MSADTAKLADLSFTLPEIVGGTGRIAQIVTARQTAKSTAGRIETVAAEDARLRKMQAARLLGQQRASFAARGVEGGSAGAISRETLALETLDVGRTLQQGVMLANEVRRRGLASALESTLGIAQDYALYGNALRQREELEKQRRATIVPPAPKVKLGNG